MSTIEEFKEQKQKRLQELKLDIEKIGFNQSLAMNCNDFVECLVLQGLRASKTLEYAMVLNLSHCDDVIKKGEYIVGENLGAPKPVIVLNLNDME